MATRGFEFAYMLDGSNATPVIRDWGLAAVQDVNIGDALTITSAGYGTAVSSTTTEVLGIAMEDTGGAVATAGDKYKIAIVTREQVWRCSMDATSSTAIVGFNKMGQFVDGNTIDADAWVTGGMILVDGSTKDDDGYVLGYVVFADTTFGNT